MTTRLFDLAQPGVALPDRLAVDTNVLVTRFLPPPTLTPAYLARRAQVRAFFVMTRAQSTTVFAPFVVFSEFVHVAIKVRFRDDLASYAGVVGGKKNWELLYKARPDLLDGYTNSFRAFHRAFARLNIIVIQPGTLAPWPRRPRVEEHLLDLVARHRLDSTDAAILLELRRAGLDAIATEDPDLRRAAPDFAVYTWL